MGVGSSDEKIGRSMASDGLCSEFICDWTGCDSRRRIFRVIHIKFRKHRERTQSSAKSFLLYIALSIDI